jgi:hypothetical protein
MGETAVNLQQANARIWPISDDDLATEESYNASRLIVRINVI